MTEQLTACGRFSIEHMREIGRRGGLALVAKHGREHMADIGAKGGMITQGTYYLSPIWQGWLAGDIRPGDRLAEEIKAEVRAQLAEVVKHGSI